MYIKKHDLQNHLNAFSWDYREIFFEKSKSFRILCLNGQYKTPAYSTLEWVSILSRTQDQEYFKVFSDTENISQKIQIFLQEFSLWEKSQKVELLGEEELFLESLEDLQFDVEDIISATQEVFNTYIKASPYIVSSEISLNISKKSFIVWNTSGKFWKDINFYHTFFVKLVWEKWENREEIYEKITGTDIWEKINKESIEKLIKNACEVLEKQLNWRPSPSGKMDVIIWNESGGTIIHEAVWHGLEADLQSSSVYKGKIGQKVASEKVTIVDNPTHLYERGFYRVDHEGHTAQNTVLIENWVLKSYLHNSKTASKFQVSSTGHGRRENYKYKTLVRMGNTYMLPGDDKKEELIKNISYGLYVSRMGWGQVNTITGDFVFKVQNGFLIENGVMTHNVTGATLSGNGPEMLQEIYGICDDLEFFDGGTCGKWQSMPVSDGVPTFWTKLKVSGLH